MIIAAVPRQIARRADDDEAKGPGQAHLHHVALDRLAEAHTRVVPLRDDVDEAVFGDDFDVYSRMLGAKFR